MIEGLEDKEFSEFLKTLDFPIKETLSAEDLLRAMIKRNPNLLNQINGFLKVCGIGEEG